MDHFATEDHHQQPPPYAVPPLLDDSEPEIQTLAEFYKYPETAGLIIGDGTKLDQIPPQVAATYLQHWMYFGLLKVFLRIQSIELDKSLFVRKTASDGSEVTSSQLPKLLDEWTRKEISRPDQGQSHTDRLDTVKKVLLFVRRNLSIVTYQSVDEPVTKVIQSIQALAYSIALAMKLRFRTPFSGFTLAFSSATAFLSRLKEAGWCPHDIRILRDNFYVDTQYYCTLIPPPRQGVSHDGCSTSGCRAMNIQEATYRTRHTSPDCTCDFVTVPPEHLHPIVDRFEVPLVRYRASTGFLEVIERNGNEDSIVFSHVWADGLGNASQQNALPVCQLNRLQEIANMAYGYDPERVATPIPFYIDTLCVPRDASFRKKAIRKMRDVYKGAARVLVLDRDIESITETRGRVAICVGILFSGWMRRLWTYQEGALNESLYFKLEDSILSFVKVKMWAKQFLWSTSAIRNMLPTQWSIVISVLSYLQKTFEILDLAEVPRPLSLALLCNAFYWRSTSRKEDEPIVISTLIGQDPEALLEIDSVESRMKMLFQKIGKIPAALAVLSGARMEEPGYRWAPKSVLGVTQFDDINPLRGWYSSMLQINSPASPSFLNERYVAEVLQGGGLHLFAPGFTILPQTANQAPVGSPFWAVELQGVGQEGNPVGSGFWRVKFMEDARGAPDPLLPKVFFLVAVEDAEELFSGGCLTRMCGFVVVPDDDTANQARETFYQASPEMQNMIGTFYCRVIMWHVSDLSIVELRPEWKSELFGDTELTLHANFARRIENANWFIS